MTPIDNIDIVFLSYAEHNCEENWADLLEKHPYAIRVHGVEGSDNAHKEAARQASTDRVITVDGDCTVLHSFFQMGFDFDHPKVKDCVVSWAARNHVNGLVYGNGGIKCWPKKYIMDMKTHENSESGDPRDEIEFCWNSKYVQMNNVYSITDPSASPIQAFRAGFREGVKMSLSAGSKVSNSEFTDKLWYGNIHRLLIWMNVGADVENGLWCMLGARLGCYMVNFTDWDYIQVRDFDYIDKLFNEEVAVKFDDGTGTTHTCYKTGYSYHEDLLLQEIDNLGTIIKDKLNMPIERLSPTASEFFKKVHIGIPRSGAMVTEKEMLEMMKINGY